jgi:hypothetical protein
VGEEAWAAVGVEVGVAAAWAEVGVGEVRVAAWEAGAAEEAGAGEGACSRGDSSPPCMIKNVLAFAARLNAAAKLHALTWEVSEAAWGKEAVGCRYEEQNGRAWLSPSQESMRARHNTSTAPP